jgi:uncharacterized OsmC-like protein
MILSRQQEVAAMTQVVDAASLDQTMSVRYKGGERYEITVGDHTIAVDQPVDAGGTDAAPTPTELFVASLAGCVAYSAGRYLARHGLPREGLGVAVTYHTAESRTARVADIHLTVRVPTTIPAQSRPALQAAVERCSVHNSLSTPPDVCIKLED